MSGTAARITHEAIPELHRVLIAAAVAAVVGPGARISDIREQAGASGWVRQGRTAIQSSHDPRRQQSALRSLAERRPGVKP